MKILKHKKILILSFLFFFFFLFVFLSFKSKTTKPQPTITPGPKPVSWQNLTPGKSTVTDIKNELGEPTSINEDLYKFKSKSLTRDHEVKVQNEVGVFYKEIVSVFDKKTSEEITNKYGVPEYTLYGPDSANGSYLFVYPSSGIAYLGNPNDRSMLEVWYFKPTTLEDFQKRWASGYSESFPKTF